MKLRLALVSLLAACLSLPNLPPPPPEPVLAVGPGTARIVPGARLLFAAALGATPVTVAWSAGTGCGTIDATGAYTAPACPSPAPAPGAVICTATITASTGGSSATATLTVQDSVTVVVNPPTAKTTPGGALKFTATVTGGCGGTLTTT